MNLLYTIISYPPSVGGTQLHTHQLALHLKKRNDVQVICQWDSNRSDWLIGTTIMAPGEANNYIIDGINVHRIGLSWQSKMNMAFYVPLYYPIMNVAMHSIVHYLKPYIEPYALKADLVHNVRQGREVLSYASFQVARERNIPFVFTPAHHPRWVGWRYRAYTELYKMADALIALTSAEKRILVELGVPEARITVAGIGPILATQAEPEEFLNKHKIDGPMVLFLGRHDSYKGYRQVLQAAKLVWQKIPETHFVFVGPAVNGSEKYFEKPSDARVRRLYNVNLQEKTNAIAACTVLCVPSTQESFGGVYTEAWNYAKPVIGCMIPAVAEVIADGVDGYLIEQDSAQIADRICHLLLHPTQAQKMGESGQRKVLNHYSWERIAELIESAYGKALGVSVVHI
jgi:glycosyltransferase involved in cell wall biosynthesis